MLSSPTNFPSMQLWQGVCPIQDPGIEDNEAVAGIGKYRDNSTFGANPNAKRVIVGSSFSQPRTPTGIQDLPNELLIYILTLGTILSPKDVFHMSLLSRGFQAIAMPIFLAHHGISDPEEETSIYVMEWNPHYIAVAEEPDALRALATLNYLSKINHFRCFFQDPNGKRNSFQQAFHLPDAMNRVSRFVQKLKHVGTVEIYLMWDPYFIHRERSAVPFSEIRRWVNSFGYLLNLLLLRGCAQLTVQYDATIAPPFHFRSTNRVKRAFSLLSQNVLRRDGAGQAAELQWEFERPLYEEKWESLPVEKVDSPALASLGQGFNHMTYLAIHSPSLLLPPFTHWTLSLLRAHPNLTSISFAYITFSKDIWATLLPLIADAISTKLTTLSFFRNCPELDTEDLFYFLNRLPNLRHFSLDRSFRSRLQDIKPHKLRALFTSSPIVSGWSGLPAFLHLETLHAPAELVTLLLDSHCHHPSATGKEQSFPSFLPRLKNLTLYPSNRLIHPPSYIKSSLLINALLQRMTTARPRARTTFSLDAQMEFTDFGPVIQYIETINTRQEFRRVVWETLSEADIETLMKNNSVPLIAFIHITHLVLYRFKMPAPQQEQNVGSPPLCTWINLLFPNLDTLEFTFQLEAMPKQSGIDIDKTTTEWLIDAMRDTCPKVLTVIIGKKFFDMKKTVKYSSD